MKKFNKFFALLGSTLAAFALMIGTVSANSPCVLYLHQPKVPNELNKLKK